MPTQKPKVVAALLAFLVVLSSLSFGVPADEVSPKTHYDSHRWFEFRDAVAKGCRSSVLSGCCSQVHSMISSAV
jgi:hypothetical protein